MNSQRPSPVPPFGKAQGRFPARGKVRVGADPETGAQVLSKERVGVRVRAWGCTVQPAIRSTGPTLTLP